MTKEEIHLALDKLEKNFIPDVLDPAIEIIIRVAMNQAFIFGIEIGEDDESRSNALKIIKEWENQFNID